MKMKALALLLTLVMVVSLAACADSGSASDPSDEAPQQGAAIEGGTDPSDWPTVSVQILVSSEMPAEARVEEALNEYLVSIDAGVLVDMVQINFGDMSTVLTLMLTDNSDPLDLWCWRFYSDLDNIVKNDQCIPLDKYKDIYPDLWEMYPEQVMMSQQINGVQYAIPSMDSFATYETYMLREDVAQNLGIADRDGEFIDLEEMTQIMKDAKELQPEYAYMINTNIETVIGIDSLGNSNWLGVLMDRGVDQTEIVNLYETDAFREYCYLMRDWNQSNLFIDDPLNNEMTISQFGNGVAAGCFVGGYSEDYIKALVSYLDPSVQFPMTELVGTSASVLGGWMISSTSKQPDAAMKVLHLMATNEDVARFFILGVEGENYVVDEKGCAWYADGIDGTNTTWNMTAPWYYPNQTLSLPFETDMTSYYTDMLEAPKYAEFSKGMGFIFDSTAVYDQMVACSTVVAEYRDALLYGLVDVDTYLDSFNQELRNSGIDEIIAEEQKQFDLFLAS